MQESKLIIIAGRCGRLGNRITLFGNFLGWAADSGHRLINFTFHSYAHLFETTSRDIYCQYPVAERRSLLDRLPGVAYALRETRLCTHLVKAASQLNERHLLPARDAITIRPAPDKWVTLLDGPEVQKQIADAKVVFVNGWTFRAPECVRRQAEKVRAYFRPIPEHLEPAQQVVAALRRRVDVIIGVHVRYGDYRGWRGGKYLFTIERYGQWMREMSEQFPGKKVGFLICSDEPRSESEFPGLLVSLAPGVFLQDMYALAQCDYIIGPVSSFSQWASFYGNAPLFHLTAADNRLDVSRFQVSFLGEIPN